MSTWALTVNGVAVEITSIDPEGRFPSDMQWEPCPPDVVEGWIYSGGVFAAPFTAPTLAQLQAYANAKAAAFLSAMRTYGPLKADATAETVTDLMALEQWGAANPTLTSNWIANDNSITALTGAQFVASAPLVGAYRLLIYSTELAAVLFGITSGTITTFAQIDAYAWTV